MLFDWFTAIAQVFNFIILLVALKYLLYDRVLASIDRRREEIRQQRHDAEQARALALEEAERHRAERREIEASRDALMREARDDVERQRTQLLKEARDDVERRRSEWRRSLEDEKGRLVEHISAQVGRSAIEISERVLAELADESLHGAIVERFVRHLGELDDGERSRIAAAVDDHAITVESSFVIDEAARERLVSAIRDELGAAVAAFEVDADLIAGVRLAAGGRYVGWSVRDYSDALAGELTSGIGGRKESA